MIILCESATTSSHLHLSELFADKVCPTTTLNGGQVEHVPIVRDVFISIQPFEVPIFGICFLVAFVSGDAFGPIRFAPAASSILHVLASVP